MLVEGVARNLEAGELGVSPANRCQLCRVVGVTKEQGKMQKREDVCAKMDFR